MITLQHSLVYLSALIKDGKVDLEEFKRNVPWVLAPDAMRYYTGRREYTHFEKSSTIDGETSWIEYPEDLKSLSNENLPKRYLANGIKQAVIGETTDIDTFHEHNSEHSKYRLIRAHLEQDIILDVIIRKLVDGRKKYDDDFIVNATGEKINGKEFRRRISALEKYGVLHFAGRVYEQTGILTDQQWFDENVRTALEEAYTKEMADNTYKYMIIDPEIAKRIANKEFEITGEDIAEIGLGENTEKIIKEMYNFAVERTKKMEELDTEKDKDTILSGTQRHREETEEER